MLMRMIDACAPGLTARTQAPIERAKTVMEASATTARRRAMPWHHASRPRRHEEDPFAFFVVFFVVSCLRGQKRGHRAESSKIVHALRPSENQLQRKLNLASRERPRRSSERRLRHVAIRTIEVHVVEDVERLGTELDLRRRSGREGEVLEERQIQCLVMRRAIRVAREAPDE